MAWSTVMLQLLSIIIIIIFTLIEPTVTKEKPNCIAPVAPVNGFVYSNSLEAQATALYRCKPKHKLIGSNTNFCLQRGRWQKRTPICLPVCKTPKVLPNRQHFLSYDEQIGDEKLLTSVNFLCNNGFKLVGKETLTCESGVWSDKEPQCVRTCGTLEHPPNGFVQITIDKDSAPDYKATFTCNDGYTLRGSQIRKCVRGSWSGQEPTCELSQTARCSEPSTPVGVSKRGTPPYNTGSSVTFSCNDGSGLLIGASRIVCDSEGKWSGDVPTCLIVADKKITCDTTANEILDAQSRTPIRIKCPSNCASSQSPVYGTVIYKGSSSICRAGIHSGVVKSQGNSVTIVNNGQYSRFLPSNINGINSQSDNENSLSFTFGNDVPKDNGGVGSNKKCPTAWMEFEGSCILIVNKKKLWSEAEAVCGNLDSGLIDTSEAVKVPKYQKIMSDKGISSAWITAKCQSIQVGQAGIRRNEDCRNRKEFICQLHLVPKGKSCADPGEEMNGNRIFKNTFDGMFYSRTTITYSCNDLYYLSGKSTITCLSSGKWNDKKPRCIRIPACVKLSEIYNAIIRYSIPVRPNPSSGNVAEFVEETSGPPSRIARLPDFAAASFPSSLTAISDVKEKMYNGPVPDGHYRAGARAIISCKSKFYKHIGSKIRTCRKTGVWSGTSTSCIPVCGVSSAPRAPFIVNGNVSEAGQWPWQAGIARWLPKDEKYIILCGGSLIRQNWVLTAAHCVTFQGSKTVIPSSQFRIYLGKYYRDDSLDDEQVQMKVVSEIYVNQDYDAVVLDADIALVKLNEPAILTARVRPVCLPTLSSSNENLVVGAVGIVIGWGLNENDTYSEKLMQARTPFVSRKTCIEGYKSAGFPLTVTNYMYCAGYKEGKIDACSGDSGGPMVFKDSSTGRWTQEGIVSWGSPNGCGKTNQYGGYARIEVFMNWIDQFL